MISRAGHPEQTCVYSPLDEGVVLGCEGTVEVFVVESPPLD